MTKRIYIYTLFGSLLLSISCSHDDMGGDINDLRDGKIQFRASLPEVSSRASELTLSTLTDFQVSSFTLGVSSITPYFLEKDFTGSSTGMFTSSDQECVWPNNNDLLRFVAFSPSCAAMRQAGGANILTYREDVESRGYNLSGFRVANDIASHFDFVTAVASGQLLKDEEDGVELNFHHQLSRVEIKAWGASPNYSLEIAGVRLGGVGVAGDFSFISSTGEPVVDNSDESASAAGSWRSTSITKGKVDYIFREGDKVLIVDKETHNSNTDVAYILRARISGGGTPGSQDNSAMLIPSNNPAWQYKDNPSNVDGDGKSIGMYFSVLIRVIEPNSLVYPSSDDLTEVIYLAVDTENNVKAQIYKQGEEYFTDAVYSVKYDPAANGTEVKAFGWAAIPVADEWKPGYVYTYTLNYTDGVGLHDPEDPENPGEPIINSGVLVNVDVNPWKRAYEDDKNVTVPRN